MIEVVDNALQLVALGICLALSLARFATTRDNAWLLICCFYVCNFFALAYWTCYLVVFDTTPSYFYVPELGWLASDGFILSFAAHLDALRAPTPPVPLAWLPVVVAVPQFLLYITHGDVLLNTACCSLIAATGFFAVRGICAPSEGHGIAYHKPFHASLLIWSLAQFAVWTTSCFWGAETFSPYIVSDLALSASLAGILACARRALP